MVGFNPFKTAVPFEGQLRTNHLEFERFVPKAGLQFFTGLALLGASDDYRRPTARTDACGNGIKIGVRRKLVS